jgi:hypothetical protein
MDTLVSKEGGGQLALKRGMNFNKNCQKMSRHLRPKKGRMNAEIGEELMRELLEANTQGINCRGERHKSVCPRNEQNQPQINFAH